MTRFALRKFRHVRRAALAATPVLFVLLAAATHAATSALPPSTRADSLAADHASLRAIADEALRVWRDSGATSSWGTSISERKHALERREDDWYGRLARIDGERFYGTDDWRLYGTLRTAVEATRALRMCHEDWWHVDQLFGWQSLATFESATAPVGTAEQRRRLIQLYEELPAVANGQIADLTTGMKAGYTAPRAMAERVIAQINAMLADSSDASDLMAAAHRDTSAEFRRAWTTTIDRYARPALRRYRDFLANEYIASARSEISLASLPHGRECYRAQLFANTGVRTDPDSLYATAVRGLDQVHTALRPLAERVVGTTDVIAAERALRSDPRFVMRDADSALAAYRTMVARAKAPLKFWFARVPAESLEVVAVPRSSAATFPPAKYVQSPGDGSAPAKLLANVYQPTGVARMNIALGVVHEGLPGHHFQYIYARSGSVAHPVMRLLGNWSLANGYREGWAIYCEVLGAEMGVYANAVDSIGYLTHLDDVYTALRTDIGIHYYGWTRAQAIDSMMIAAGRPRPQAESYADRHAASPGQLASYGIGYTEFARLRADAQARLGAQFDIRQFHDLLLDEGPIPIPLLHVKVDGWIRARTTSSPAATR